MSQIISGRKYKITMYQLKNIYLTHLQTEDLEDKLLKHNILSVFDRDQSSLVANTIYLTDLIYQFISTYATKQELRYINGEINQTTLRKLLTMEYKFHNNFLSLMDRLKFQGLNYNYIIYTLGYRDTTNVDSPEELEFKAQEVNRAITAFENILKDVTLPVHIQLTQEKLDLVNDICNKKVKQVYDLVSRKSQEEQLKYEELKQELHDKIDEMTRIDQRLDNEINAVLKDLKEIHLDYTIMNDKLKATANTTLETLRSRLNKEVSETLSAELKYKQQLQQTLEEMCVTIVKDLENTANTENKAKSKLLETVNDLQQLVNTLVTIQNQYQHEDDTLAERIALVNVGIVNTLETVNEMYTTGKDRIVQTSRTILQLEELNNKLGHLTKLQEMEEM